MASVTPTLRAPLIPPPSRLRLLLSKVLSAELPASPTMPTSPKSQRLPRGDSLHQQPFLRQLFPGLLLYSATGDAANTGYAPLTISGFTLTGANPADFFIFSNDCPAPSSTLGIGDSCHLQFFFRPSILGRRAPLSISPATPQALPLRKPLSPCQEPAFLSAPATSAVPSPSRVPATAITSSQNVTHRPSR